MDNKPGLETLWNTLYPGDFPEKTSALNTIQASIESFTPYSMDTPEIDWYQHSVVYALYLQHFNKNFTGLIEKLDYLQNLGITCLWLLPILESPMRDEGFDVSDFYQIRSDLFASHISKDEHKTQFKKFLNEAHKRNIRVIFDIALNHISIDHPWFQKALENPDSKEFHYFHWSKTGKEHRKARIIFKGMLDSNWEYAPEVGQYYFHRFYPHQPDINYGNPELLREIIEVLLYWIGLGIDGFRVDAAPYFWKDDATISENHPQTHTIIKILRAVTDRVNPATLLLAEACQPPVQVVDYFGQGDECHGAYHFPLMPRIFLSLSEENSKPIAQVLSPGITPPIPAGAQWFTFLRCHDELTLEMVSPEERKSLHRAYCKDPSWDFREGEGISSRLLNLVGSPQRALLAHAILLGLTGTPVIYYGDEVLTKNNREFNLEWADRTGYTDSRNLVRGPLNWEDIDSALANPDSPESWHYTLLGNLIRIRTAHIAFGHGTQKILSEIPSLLGIKKEFQGKVYELWYNLSITKSMDIPCQSDAQVLIQVGLNETRRTLNPNGFVWFLC